MSDLFNPALVTGAEEQQQSPVTERVESGFDWEGDHVVCQKQPRTAVYRNRFGQIAIRQEADYPDDDAWLLFNDDVVPQLIRHLAGQIGVMDDVNDALLKNDL